MVSHPRRQELFHIVSQKISEQIENGTFASGSRLPSERWLGQTLGVSRATVRRAMVELTCSGAIETRGHSVYISQAASDNPSQNTITSLTEFALARGLTPTAKVLCRKERPATLDEAEILRCAPGAALFELERLRLLDGTAIAVDHNRVPLRFLPNALAIDFSVASLFASLTRAGHAPVLSRLQIEARSASKRETKLLQFPGSTPVLVATEQTIGEGGQIVGLGRTIYRSDRHRLLATFVRSPLRDQVGASR